MTSAAQATTETQDQENGLRNSNIAAIFLEKSAFMQYGLLGRYRVFLKIAGAGLVFLGFLGLLTILMFPVLTGRRVLGIVPNAPETSLLIFSALCAGAGFFLFVVAWNQFLVDSDTKERWRAWEAAQKPRMKLETIDAQEDLKSRQRAHTETFLKVAATGLLILGLATGLVFYLTKIDWLPELKTTTHVLWWLFVPATLLGIAVALLAQKEQAAQTFLIKKLIDRCLVESMPKMPVHRKRARFTWQLPYMRHMRHRHRC